MRALLVVLVLGVSAGGVFLATRRTGGGIELQYSVRFPAGFAGDRKAAGLQVVKVLGTRLEHQGRAWMAFVDRKGVITLRIAAVPPEDIPSLRRVLETEGRFEAYEVADRDARAFYEATGALPCGYREVHFTKPLPVRERPVFDASDILPITEERMGVVERPPAYLNLDPESHTRWYDERHDGTKELLVMLDGETFSLANADSVGMAGWFLVPGPKDESEARETEAIYGSGRLPYAIGEPEVNTYRGRLR